MHITNPTFHILVFYLYSCTRFCHGSTAAPTYDNNTRRPIAASIGAIVDMESRNGKEEKVAMAIAIKEFNTSPHSHHLSLSLFVHHASGGNPLQAAFAVENLIDEKKAQAIIGVPTWEEAVVAAVSGNRSRVPIISLEVAPWSNPQLTSQRWPFLVRMSHNYPLQMKCIADIVRAYQWQRVIAIYEDSFYGGDGGTMTLLSDALVNAGSEIDHRLSLPPLVSLPDPKTAVRQELEKLKGKQCKVFVVLRLSPPLAGHLFTEAKQMGMMGNGYVWITDESVTSILDSADSSFISSSMQGVLGIKTYVSETNPSFRHFRSTFRRRFQREYPEEDNPGPGIFALSAYDAIWAVARAIERNYTGGQRLLEGILSSDFKGLSGKIRFKDGEVAHSPAFQVINAVGRSYIELGFWSSEFGFSATVDREESGGTMKVLGRVFWPGGTSLVPKGRATPPDMKPLTIGVPGKTIFDQFVNVEYDQKQIGPSFSGFSIDVFEEVVNQLGYDLPHVFEPFNGTYDDLVMEVYLKNYDAVVGDITILANRSKYVEFTQPYAESGLSMLVAVKSSNSEKAWMFMKPFTKAMWCVTGAVFVYTGLVVWFLEHRSNPDFRGPWRSQLGTVLWFTFSTLFFAHRERLRSNFSRVVIVVWLFVVLVLTSSYTASLTSMLTIQRMEPTVTQIDLLRRSNLRVGLDGDSFMVKYLEEVMHFDPKNIEKINNVDDFPEALKSGRIAAAFLEIPYMKIIQGKYCNGFADAGPHFRLGGLGFVFPKGSPLARDVSRAILELSERGKIKELENLMTSSYSKCSKVGNEESLSLDNFWGLFVITGGTSTTVLLLFLMHLLRKFRQFQHGNEGNASPPTGESVWKRAVTLAKYWDKGQLRLPQNTSTSSPSTTSDATVDEWTSVSLELVSVSNTPQHHQSHPASTV